jgi:dTDP-4-dehydrorhamnose reductase
MHGNNFVKTMIRLGKERDDLGVIFDQIGTPTYAGDLAEVILQIIKHDMNNTILFKPGIYHYSNEGVASWYDFTLAIHREMGLICNVKPIETKDYPTPAPRPNYSVLNKSKIKKAYQIEIPYWLDSLKKCLAELK